MRRSRAWRLAGVMALVALLVAPALPGATGGRVQAHAQLVASSPGAGAVLDESPEEIRLAFSEPLEVQVTSLDLRSQGGEVDLERVGEIDPDDPYALVLASPELPDGTYSVTWRTLSAADGHTGQGTFSFGIGVSEVAPSDAASMTHTETDAPGVIGRWLTYVGLLAALGVAIFHRVVIRKGPMPRALVRMLAAGLFIAAAATFAVAVITALEAGAIGEYLMGTRNGGLQLARAVIAALGGVLLLVVPPRWAGPVAAGAGLTGIVLLVSAGHAAVLPGPVTILAHVVHVAAAAVWIGGIAALLALVLVPTLIIGNATRPNLRTLVPRFSALALTSLGLVAASGTYAAWVQTGSLLPLGSEYGNTLVLKTAFFLGAGALGAANYIDGGRLLVRIGNFRSRLSLEVLAAGVVLAFAALLATTSPTDDPAGIAIEPIPDAFGEVAPGMSMQVPPGRPGVNRIVVTTTDAMAASPGLELGLDRLDDGTSSRVPLVLESMGGMEHGGMAGMPGMDMSTPDGTVDWTADAIILPPESRWDTSVRILSADGAELSRQRFAFALSDGRIVEGRVTSLLNPATGIVVLLLVVGATGLGLGFGGARLPRCAPDASRVALIAGGTVGVLLGGAIGVERLMTL